MKKILAAFFTCALAATLTGCGMSEPQSSVNISQAISSSTVVDSQAPSSLDESTDSLSSSSSETSTNTHESFASSPSTESVAEITPIDSELNTESVTESTSTPEESSSVIEPQPIESDENKILIAYFSWSGTTKQLAEMIAEDTGGDLFEIVPETPYTTDYNEMLDIAQEEQRNNARPAVANAVENWSDYDTVFIGYPNWWNDAPMIVLSFLESYDCGGKTLVPFNTSGGSRFGRSLDSLAKSAPGADFLDGFETTNIGGARSDVTAWINGLGL